MKITLRKMQRHIEGFHGQLRDELAKGPSVERVGRTWGAILETHHNYLKGLKERVSAMSRSTDEGFRRSLSKVEEKFRKTLSEAAAEALTQEEKVEHGIGTAQKFLRQ